MGFDMFYLLATRKEFIAAQRLAKKGDKSGFSDGASTAASCLDDSTGPQFLDAVVQELADLEESDQGFTERPLAAGSVVAWRLPRDLINELAELEGEGSSFEEAVVACGKRAFEDPTAGRETLLSLRRVAMRAVKEERELYAFIDSD